MRKPLQRWVPRVVTPSGKKVLARFKACESLLVGDSRKYFASRSICSTPGLEISPLAIFSRVRKGTPLPEETAGQDPLADCSAPNTKSKIESAMATNRNPIFGVKQPGNGFCSGIAYAPMGRPRKPPAPVRTPKDVIGQILAANIRELMEEVYSAESNETERSQKLANASGVSKETIRRILGREVSPRLDNIQMIAIALGTDTANLLSPAKSSNAVSSQEQGDMRNADSNRGNSDRRRGP